MGVKCSLPIVWHCAGGGNYGESVLTFLICFDVDIFSFTPCAGVTELVSGFVLEGLCSCRFGASVGRGKKFRSLLCYHLGQMLQAF